VISTGIKRGKAAPEVVEESVATMMTPGKYAAEAIAKFDVKAATDVTGFALLGHAWEMACASTVTIEIDSSRVPLINGALELVAAGMLTGADKTNREYVGEDVSFANGLDPNLVKLLYDPQTAGGLLLAVSEEKADDLLTELRRNYSRAEIIGGITKRGDNRIKVS
jgi:selenide, water dikinase